MQIVEKKHGQRRILKHVGSAHTEGELAALMLRAREMLVSKDQPAFEFDETVGGRPVGGGAVVQAQASQLLVEVIRSSWSRLKFDTIEDEAFFQLVVARLVEPTSKIDSLRVIDDLGMPAVHISSVKRALRRCAERDYREQITKACFDHVWYRHGGDVSLLLYDVTTLYFEVEKEDKLRKVGYSKERRVDPQIIVGLLVDRSGFPLEIACYEGNKAETATIIPVLEGFRKRHQIADMVVVADAGMLSEKNLTDIHDAGLRFIVGSRVTKAPHDLGKHLHWVGTNFADGQIVDTITMRRGNPDPDRLRSRAEPVWTPAGFPKAWRAVWQYSATRARRDQRTLNEQEARAKDIVDGIKPAKKARFVNTGGANLSLDEASLQRARDLIGLKGYVTNITAEVMPAVEIIASYHDLWRVEESFRMSKHDLAARPIFHRERQAIDAHLTIVFTALAIARDLQARTGVSLKKIIRTLRPLRHVTISVGEHHLEAEPAITPDAAEILNSLGH